MFRSFQRFVFSLLENTNSSVIIINNYIQICLKTNLLTQLFYVSAKYSNKSIKLYVRNYYLVINLESRQVKHNLKIAFTFISIRMYIFDISYQYQIEERNAIQSSRDKYLFVIKRKKCLINFKLQRNTTIKIGILSTLTSDILTWYDAVETCVSSGSRRPAPAPLNCETSCPDHVS